MSCEIHWPRIADALRGSLSPGEASTLAAHLETCAACRTELAGLRQLWDELADLPAPVPPPGMAGAFRQALGREAGRGRPGRVRRFGPAAAALVAGLVLGYALRALMAGAPPAAPVRFSATGVERSFLLLLHEPEPAVPLSPQVMAPLVSEYAAWGRALRESGRLDDGAKLEDRTGLAVTEAGAAPLPFTPGSDVVSGFFLIRAHDYVDALRVIRDHPHLRRGTIELRAIEETGG
jgi:hypothetical protein